MLNFVVEYHMLTAQKPDMEGFPSGQRERTVNPSAPPSKVRILLPPIHRGMEQLVARRAHNPKVVGSSPAPAINADIAQ